MLNIKRLGEVLPQRLNAITLGCVMARRNKMYVFLPGRVHRLF